MPISSSIGDPEYHILLALQKMGVYMERDKSALAALSAEDQALRLQSAFDKTVETYCILPLLFNKKELKPGKLKLSHRNKWRGWDEDRRAVYLSDSNHMRGLVRAIGEHSLWGAFRIARHLVEASAKIQGASVRWGNDVKYLETLIVRFCLGFLTQVDIAGRAAGLGGAFWSLTDIPANNNDDTKHLPRPIQSSAVFAMQVLDVIEIELEYDVDTREDEKDVRETEFQKYGYRGNINRRAIPVVVVRYASSLPGFGTKEDVAALVGHTAMHIGMDSAYITKTHLSMFTRLLASNARFLAPEEKTYYKRDLPAHLRARTNVSFVSPIFCPSPAVADRIELGGKHLLTCAICGKEQDNAAGVKLSYCSSCCGAAYCSPEHQKQDWSEKHKSECKLSTKRRTINKNKKPSTILVPLTGGAAKQEFWEGQMCEDDLRYGREFLVRARWGGHVESMFGISENERHTDGFKNLGSGSMYDSFVQTMMNVIHFIDRAQSLGSLLQRRTGMSGGMMIHPPNMSTQGMNEDNSVVFDTIVDIMRKHSVARDKTQVFYFWAVRRGDCLEIDLEDLPDQGLGW